MERTDQRRALQVCERALLAIAVVFLAWYAVDSFVTRLDQASQSRALDALRENQPAPASSPAPTPASSGAHAAARQRPAARSLVGRIEVRRLGLSAIVREGVDEGTLRRAVGHVPDTVLPGQPGNAALAAHRDTFFRPLKDIRKGDLITVTTPDGAHQYRVAETKVVNPDDVSVLAPTSNPTLTLVTCYPFNFVGSAPQRFIVRAEAPGAPAASVGAPVVEQMLPVKAAAIIAESPRAPTAVRRVASKSKKAKSAAPHAVRKNPTPKAPTKKAGPFRKFLRLFTGPPDRSTSPPKASRRPR